MTQQSDVRDRGTAGPGVAAEHVGPERRVTRWVRTLRTVRTGGEEGMATAEYAIATVAAAGFAGLLLLVLRSDEVRGALTAIVRSALAV